MRCEELRSVNNLLVRWDAVLRAKMTRPREHGVQVFFRGVIQSIFERCVSYSMRSACIGEIEAARLAGMMAAKKEQIARAPAAIPNANGSQEVTP
jgi:hypothetical protein